MRSVECCVCTPSNCSGEAKESAGSLSVRKIGGL